MSGKMKKLICALLTGTMLLSSAGMLAFADDETPAENNAAAATEATAAPEAAEATAAPEAAEATAAPEATEATAAPEAAEATEAPAAPVAAATKYDSDNYYKKALALCQGLGIIKGDEKGNVNPENLVTRAEMAAIILRMLNNNSLSTYQNIFSDVSTSHWAADTVQTASALGIVNGYPEDKTFRPDNDVMYEQVAKMIVCAMNYQDSADIYGGYPNGFMKVASDLDIINSAPGSVGVAAERGIVIKMIYNALLADFNEPDGMQYGHQQYKADRTLAEYAFDVKEAKGILLGTSTTTLIGADLQKGQVAIKTNGEEDAVVYDTELDDLDSMLASNITFYYEDKNGGDDRKLLAVAENAAKTTSVTLSKDDVANIETFKGFDGNKGEIKLYNSKKHKLSSSIEVVYNGELITINDFEDAKATAKADDPRFAGKEWTDFLNIDVGTIRLVENNDENDGYDIAFIEAYETLLVTSATTKKVMGNIKNTPVTIDVDEDANDLTIKTTINGMTAAPRNLKKNNVASLKRSLSGENLEFVVTGETVIGAISSKGENEDGVTIVTISGTDYEVDDNAVKNCKIGTQATFYLDAFDRIGYIETATSDGLLQAGEKYGWIMGAYVSEDGENKVLRLYTQDGKSAEANLGSKIDFWASNATEPESKTDDEVYQALLSGGSLNDKSNTAFIKMGTGVNATPIRLVKYKMNAKNEVTRLYLAVDYSKVEDESAMRVNTTNLTGKPAVNGTVSGYSIPDGITELSVPSLVGDMASASNYAVGEVVSSNYVVRETGSGDNYIIGEFDGLTANVVIKFTASATDAAKFTDMDTAGGGPSVMVVKSIGVGYDEENDTDVYTINGYLAGSEISIKTMKNTIFGELTGPMDKVDGKNGQFKAKEIWQAPKPNGNKLTDFLKAGDILLYTTEKDGSRVLIRYASAKNAVIDEEGNITKKDNPMVGVVANPSWSARVAYYFDKVTEVGMEDQAYVKVAGVKEYLSFSPDISATLVTISKSTGTVKVDKSALPASDILEGDYFWINYYDKQSAVKAVIVYRVED